MFRSLIGGLCLLLLVLNPVQGTVRYHCPITGASNQGTCCCPGGELVRPMGSSKVAVAPVRREASRSERERPCCNRAPGTERQSLAAARCCDIEYDAVKPFFLTKGETFEHRVQLLHAASEPPNSNSAHITDAAVALLLPNHSDPRPPATALPVLLCSFLC